MISTIYIEHEVADHPRVKAICQRFKQAEIVYCDHYGELFNRKAQNFRLQKKNPSLILAYKKKQFVLPAPEAYGIGGDNNYYFSHMMNCIYDCRYCFLQGMYRSAHYVVFVNFEDFAEDIIVTANDNPSSYFFSGYDCDSMALEPVTHFVDTILPVFEKLPDAWLELRTKSTQIRGLLDREALPNCIVAFSLSPDNIVSSLEAKTPSLQKRIEAIKKLQKKGWQIGLRFDPLIYHNDYEKNYLALFETVFSQVEVSGVHSVSAGSFRMPETFFRNMVKLYPKEKMFSSVANENKKMASYAENFCEVNILKYIPQDKYFPCL